MRGFFRKLNNFQGSCFDARADLREDDIKRIKNKHVLKLPLEVTHTMSIKTPSIEYLCFLP